MDLVNVKKPASIVTASQYKAMEYKVEDNTEEEKKNTPSDRYQNKTIRWFLDCILKQFLCTSYTDIT